MSFVPNHSSPWSLTRCHLCVPLWFNLCLFASVCPSSWNNLPQSLGDLFHILFDQFCKHLNTSHTPCSSNTSDKVALYKYLITITILIITVLLRLMLLK